MLMAVIVVMLELMGMMLVVMMIRKGWTHNARVCVCVSEPSAHQAPEGVPPALGPD